MYIIFLNIKTKK